jgi:undecaprenyl phosphate N,N'-diacetylbacillosamine 1-phosphate transferase
VGKVKNSIYRKYVKRGLDLSISLMGLVLFWWVFVIVAVLVKAKLGSPILYSVDRPGLNGKLFKLYKFRSMTNERDSSGNLLPEKERTPRFGSVLRSTSLDEIPEIFINVIRGDMSLIGPRPLAQSYLPYYTKEEMHRHDVLPGITGLAQIKGRNNLQWEERFALDLTYVKNLSFRLDIYIFFQTILKVVKRSDVADTAIAMEMDFSTYREDQWKR